MKNLGREKFMWPFARKNRDIRKAFSPYLSEEAIKALADGTYKVAEPVESEISFVLLHVHDGSPREVLSRLSRVIGQEMTRNLVVESLMSSIVLGIMFENSEDISDLGERLLKAGGENIRIIYGKEICLRGMVGLTGGAAFSTIIPDFIKAVSLLISSEFGTLTEWHRAGTA